MKRMITVAMLLLALASLWPLGKCHAAEQSCEYRFPDGTGIKVHYTAETLKERHQDSRFAQEVLDAAVAAYQTITVFNGFSTSGFSFAHPDKSFAVDPDKTIDIYIGGPNDELRFLHRGLGKASFKDAPCFDTAKLSETEYDAMILIPAGYREFIRNWERINPSSLGQRNVHVDLRGTLMHEMLHAILFYYNKNLNKDDRVRPETEKHNLSGRKIDWYVEGLARYFETFAGARHDFYSKGFRQTFPTKVRFSRGGCNYFMRYSDQDFMDLRYENALFWRFVHTHYGMEAIEKLSRALRDAGQNRTQQALEEATGDSFERLLKTFALSILLKNFGLKEDTPFLKDVAATQLICRKGDFYLVDGAGAEKTLGPICATDWIGSWDDQKARFGEKSVAGDSTESGDVSGWATDFFRIGFDKEGCDLPWLGVSHVEGGLPLAVQMVVVTRGGAQILKETADISHGQTRGFDLRAIIKDEGLRPEDVQQLDLLITNTDPAATSQYEIRADRDIP